MTSKEIRNEIYNYIYDNVLPKDYDRKLWFEQRDELKSLLKQFEATVNPLIFPTRSTEHKHKPLSLKTAKELQEEDIKKGIWRPIEFYS